MPGTRMSYWIAHTLREERENAGVTRRQIATALDTDQSTVVRLERGLSMGRDIDRAVAAYAYVLGLEDGRELWRLALERWQQHGSPPRFNEEGPAAEFARAIRSAALRQSPYGDAQQGTQPSTRRPSQNRKRRSG